MNGQHTVFELSVGLISQLPPSDLPEIAISGHSNVGKSSLINRMTSRRALARTSATPGKTATINFYRSDICRLVDLPGYGYAKTSQAERKRFRDLIFGYYEAEDRDLRLVIQLLDIRHPTTKEDRAMIEFLVDHELPFVVVLTKVDKLNKTEREKCEQSLAKELSNYEGLITIPFSAVTGEGAEDLNSLIDEVCGD